MLDEQICGTINSEEASHFYIEITREEDPLLFNIEYKTSKGTQLKVKVEQPYQSHRPLQLTEPDGKKSDFVYTLQDTQDENFKFPPSPHAWKNYSPFLIKQPEIWLGLIKAKRYVAMKKYENGHDEKYQTLTFATVDTENKSLMLFYLRKVIIQLSDDIGCIPLSVEPICNPTGMQESDDVCLWMVTNDQEDTKSAFYQLVGTEYILL